MKRLILFISLFILQPLILNCQVIIGLKIGYGFIFPFGNSINSNDYPFKDATLTNEKNCFFISGKISERSNNRMFNLGGEIEYYNVNLSGFQVTGDLNNWTRYTYEFDLNFLNLIFNPEFVFGSKYKFIINTGVYMQILIAGKANGIWFKPNDYLNRHSFEASASYFFNSLNLGLTSGLGLEMPISKRIFLNLHSGILIGITRLANKSLIDKFYNLISLQFSGGISYKFNFNLKKPQISVNEKN